MFLSYDWNHLLRLKRTCEPQPIHTKFPCIKRRRHTASLAQATHPEEDVQTELWSLFWITKYVQLRILIQRLVEIQSYSKPQTKEKYIWENVFQKVFFSFLAFLRPRFFFFQKETFNTYPRFTKFSCTKRRRLTRSLTFNRVTHPT